MSRLLLAGCLVAGCLSSVSAADEPLTWNEIKQTADHFFAAKANYVAGDLLTRGDVQPLLDQLKQRGLQFDSVSVGFDPFLPDSSGLAHWLKSAPGHAVMRRLAVLPNAYDRLDRLSWFPQGQLLLKKAVADKEPLKAVEALVSDASAAEIEKRFRDEPLAANFSVPSGRIYTQAKLMDLLRTLHVMKRDNLAMPGR